MYVVTGGGTGIGRAVALALHGQGENVLITGRREEPLAAVAHESSGHISFLTCDNADPADAQRLADAVGGPGAPGDAPSA